MQLNLGHRRRCPHRAAAMQARSCMGQGPWDVQGSPASPSQDCPISRAREPFLYQPLAVAVICSQRVLASRAEVHTGWGRVSVATQHLCFQGSA